MMTWTGAVQVFACLEPTDMRKSFDGLCGVVELGMGRRVETGSLAARSGSQSHQAHWRIRGRCRGPVHRAGPVRQNR